jgi:DNA-binding transcriptional regulator GbsR (MarR family)
MRHPHTWNETVDQFASGCARTMGMYGVNPLMGRLFGVLFLSPEPLTLDALSEQVGAAKSTVSVAIRKLAGAHLVRRQWKKGDRRDYWEAVSDPHTVIEEWTHHFFEPEGRTWNEITSIAMEALDHDNLPDALPDTDRDEVRARIQGWETFAQQAMTLLGQFMTAIHQEPPDEP